MTATAKRLLFVSVLIVALAAPATASAATRVHKLSGVFDAEGVPGTGKVSIEVVMKAGKPFKLRNLAFTNLPAMCNVSETPFEPIYEPAGKLTGNAGKNKNPPGIEYGLTLFWVSYPGNGARQVLMNGKLNPAGTRIKKGKLEVHNNKACQSAVGTFTAKK